jgi:hypothetical protein
MISKQYIKSLITEKVEILGFGPLDDYYDHGIYKTTDI